MSNSSALPFDDSSQPIGRIGFGEPKTATTGAEAAADLLDFVSGTSLSISSDQSILPEDPTLSAYWSSDQRHFDRAAIFEQLAKRIPDETDRDECLDRAEHYLMNSEREGEYIHDYKAALVWKVKLLWKDALRRKQRRSGALGQMYYLLQSKQQQQPRLDEEETGRLQAAIDALATENKFILDEYFFKGSTYVEIGRRLKVAPSTVGRKLAAILQQLRNAIE